MTSYNTANQLRGFLESLSGADNISKLQVKMLLSKLEQFISEIDSEESTDAIEDLPLIGSNIRNNSGSYAEPADDLPF